MKTKILFLSALTFSLMGFSQKAELKSAEKALKSGDNATAKTVLESASSLIAGADDKYKVHYQYLLGEVNYTMAKGGDTGAFNAAITAYQKVVAMEEASGKSKYSNEARQKMQAMTADLVNSAVKDNADKKYKEAAEKLYLSYKLSPKDTNYLYFAASSAVTGGDYKKALQHYNELKDLGYDGSGTVYKAKNVATGKVEEMDKVQRDLMVKSGTYSNPVDEKTPSKTPEIIKNIALIYTQLGQDDKALAAYKDARANDPKDVTLILNEANLYYKLGDKEKFKSLMAEATAVSPNNPDLWYNIGVINMEQGNIMEARDAYKKTLEINPGYINAQLNLSTTYVNEGNSLIDDMNALGNSRADIARYDELKQKKDDLFMEGAKVLEEAIKTNPDNQGILTQLKNIYGAMGDNENFMRIKKLLGE